MKLASHGNQTEAFLGGEGDCWYERNKSAIETAPEAYDEAIIAQTLQPFATEIDRVLEIGCSSGMKLERLCDHFGAGGWGIDPSSKAVEAGNHRFGATGKKNLELKVGSADALPFGDNEFELV